MYGSVSSFSLGQVEILVPEVVDQRAQSMKVFLCIAEKQLFIRTVFPIDPFGDSHRQHECGICQGKCG